MKDYDGARTGTRTTGTGLRMRKRREMGVEEDGR